MSKQDTAGLWSFVFMYSNYYNINKPIERIIAAFHYYMIIKQKFQVIHQGEVRNANKILNNGFFS
jgi:hypothetical protein